MNFRINYYEQRTTGKRERRVVREVLPGLCHSVENIFMSMRTGIPVQGYSTLSPIVGEMNYSTLPSSIRQQIVNEQLAQVQNTQEHEKSTENEERASTSSSSDE